MIIKYPKITPKDTRERALIEYQSAISFCAILIVALKDKEPELIMCSNNFKAYLSIFWYK